MAKFYELRPPSPNELTFLKSNGNIFINNARLLFAVRNIENGSEEESGAQEKGSGKEGGAKESRRQESRKQKSCTEGHGKRIAHPAKPPAEGFAGSTCGNRPIPYNPRSDFDLVRRLQSGRSCKRRGRLS